MINFIIIIIISFIIIIVVIIVITIIIVIIVIIIIIVRKVERKVKVAESPAGTLVHNMFRPSGPDHMRLSSSIYHRHYHHGHQAGTFSETSGRQKVTHEWTSAIEKDPERVRMF